MTQVLECPRVIVMEVFRNMEVNGQQMFGRSFNLRSIQSMKRQVNSAYNRDIRIVEVPEGYLAWRKA